MYCKNCGSEKHWTLYCDKEGKDEQAFVSRSGGEDDGGRKGVGLAKSGVDMDRRRGVDEIYVERRGGSNTQEKGKEGSGIEYGRMGKGNERVSRWREKNKERYREYMRELMRKKRKKVVDKV